MILFYIRPQYLIYLAHWILNCSGMNARGLFHVLVFVLIFTVSFLPLAVLKYGLFLVPFIVSTTWIVYDGCVLNPRNADGKRQHDIQAVLAYIGWDIPRQKIGYLVGSGMVMLPTIIAGRALWS